MSKPQNAANIRSSIEKGAYDAAIVPALESYVSSQMDDNNYDFALNKSLLKLYQCYPELANVDVICSVLVLSLMRLPRTDFLLISYLVPAKHSLNPKIKFIQKCADYLESGKFKEFWESCVDGNAVAEITVNLNFRNEIRNFMMGSLKETFRSLPKDQFQQMLGLEPAEFDTFCGQNVQIEKVTADAIFLARQDDPQNRSKILEESVRFEEMLRLSENLRS